MSVFSKVGNGSIKGISVSRRQTQFKSKNDQDALIQSSRINAQLSQKTFFSSNASRPKTSISASSVSKNDKTLLGAKSFFQERSFYIPSEKEREENPQLALELLRTMTPKNCVKHLDANPVFLKAMATTGYIDNEIISSVSISLTSTELQKFLINLTFETNLFSTINVCKSINDVEKKIKI